MLLAAMTAHGAENFPPGIPRPSEVLAERYRIESLLGVGGMGAVLAATRLADGQPVAVKVLLPAAQANEEAVRRFVLEGRTCQRIRSTHIAKVHEVGTTAEGVPFLVMEHLKGLDLSEIITSRGTLTISEAVDYVTQACEAIAEAHVLGVVHRDLKPSNLFLTFGASGTPHVKVLDFGISKVTNDEDLAVKTATSFSFGTPVYMSPEQVRSTTNVDARSDIWALAVILYELLAGVPPFEAESLPALSLKIAIDPPTPLRKYVPTIPADLELVILRCLEKDPARRLQNVLGLVRAIVPFGPPSAREVLAQIEKSSEGLGQSTIALRITDGVLAALPLSATTDAAWQTQGSVTSPAPGPSMRRFAFASIGAVCVLLGVVGGLLLSRANPPPATVAVPAAEPATSPAPPTTVATPPEAAPPFATATPAHDATPPKPAKTGKLHPKKLDLDER